MIQLHRNVSNSQVYSNDEFDLWPVYSGERFRALGPLVFSRVIVCCASCIMHRPSTFENKYSNIFFYKNIAPTVLKFYMEHDLPPGSQNYKIGSGRISKMATITKNI